jgi:hypothetical protein
MVLTDTNKIKMKYVLIKAVLSLLLAVAVNAHCSLCGEGKAVGDTNKRIDGSGYSCGSLDQEVNDLDDSMCDCFWDAIRSFDTDPGGLQGHCECKDGAITAGFSMVGFAAATVIALVAM